MSSLFVYLDINQDRVTKSMLPSKTRPSSTLHFVGSLYVPFIPLAIMIKLLQVRFPISWAFTRVRIPSAESVVSNKVICCTVVLYLVGRIQCRNKSVAINEEQGSKKSAVGVSSEPGQSAPRLRSESQ